jgi:hypothetical protein
VFHHNALPGCWLEAASSFSSFAFALVQFAPQETSRHRSPIAQAAPVCTSSASSSAARISSSSDAPEAATHTWRLAWRSPPRIVRRAQATGRLQARLKVLTHPALLVGDEIGYLPISRTGAMLFFSS